MTRPSPQPRWFEQLRALCPMSGSKAKALHDPQRNLIWPVKETGKHVVNRVRDVRLLRLCLPCEDIAGKKDRSGEDWGGRVVGYCRVWPGSRMSPRRTVRRQNNCFKFCLGRVSQHPLLSSSVIGIKLPWPMKSPGRKFWQFSFIFRIKKKNKSFIYLLCVGACLPRYVHTHASAHACGSADDFQEAVLAMRFQVLHRELLLSVLVAITCTQWAAILLPPIQFLS